MSSKDHSRAIEAMTLVDDAMRRRPATIAVFMRWRLHCVGCPIGSFHTIADAAREHGVDEQALLAELIAIPPFPPA